MSLAGNHVNPLLPKRRTNQQTQFRIYSRYTIMSYNNSVKAKLLVLTHSKKNPRPTPLQTKHVSELTTTICLIGGRLFLSIN